MWHSFNTAHQVLVTGLIFLCFTPSASIADSPKPPATQPVYTTTQPSYDGIGKVYMGREIANVMSHEGADWLERPTREQEEAPSKAIAMMQLKQTDVVADIGAGTGYFSFRIAK